MVRGGIILSLAVIACGGSGKRPPLEEVPIDNGPAPTAEALPAISATVTPTAAATSSAPTSKNGSTKHTKKR